MAVTSRTFQYSETLLGYRDAVTACMTLTRQILPMFKNASSIQPAQPAKAEPLRLISVKPLDWGLNQLGLGPVQSGWQG